MTYSTHLTIENSPKLLKWVEALESGDYEQVQGALTVLTGDTADELTVEGHCCLGVMCELAIKDGVDLDVYASRSHDSIYNRSYEGETSYLPIKVLKWLGAPLSTPGVTTGNLWVHIPDATEAWVSVASMNDSSLWEYSFIQIAETVRKYGVYFRNEGYYEDPIPVPTASKM